MSAVAVRSTTPTKTGRNTHASAALLVVAAFGPYLALGIRTEQVIAYVLGTHAAVQILSGRVATHRGLTALAGIWATIASVSIVSGLNPPRGPTGSALSGLDAVLTPLAVMLAVLVWVAADDGKLITTVQKWTVGAMVVNTGVAAAMTVADIVPTLSRFWWAGSSDMATGGYAAGVGRYTGLFNTPVSAGTAYSVAICALIHLYVTRRLTGWRVPLCVGLLLTGGLLSLSKAFLLVGLLIAPILLVITVRRGTFGAVVKLGMSATLALAAFRSSPWWVEFGRPTFDLLLGGSSNPLGFYSAGRYGAGTAVSGVWEYLLENARYGGYGIRIGIGPLDTSWVEMAGRAGLIGVALFILWLVVLGGLLNSSISWAPRHQWITTGALGLVLLAAVFGGPSITQNRSGTLLLLNILPMVATLAVPRADSAMPRSEQ